MKWLSNNPALSYVLPLLATGGLYLTGLHRPVISELQSILLTTGLFPAPTTTAAPHGDTSSEVDAAAVVPPPDHLAFTMTSPDGEVVRAADLRGKVVFINLWAEWCPPCLAEMPTINALYADFVDDDRVAFVLLNVDREFARGIKLVEREGYDFPIYHLSGPLPPTLEAAGLPTTFVVSPSGELALTHTGMANYDSAEFRELLTDLARQHP